MSEKAGSILSTHCHDMLCNAELLPKDASQHHVTRLPSITAWERETVPGYAS
ncbi:hypothetical protein [Dictyobacter formicarum]|uniref:hypothetical protein n=1 Tax=Dictyobacter formicarum TaxID=2778368 RepID=UPI0019156E3B|nr:hypothetical protein [Dictyobacter formicarum]